MVKRLLQVAMHSGSSLSCGTVLVLSELARHRPALWTAINQAEEAAPNAGDLEEDGKAQKLGVRVAQELHNPLA